MEAKETIMFKEILLKSGIQHKVSKVELREGAKGDGAISLTKAVTVTFEDEKISPLELFVKLHTGNPEHEAFLEDMRLFERESCFFMDYIPQAKRLCSEKGLPNLVDIYPKCYYADKDIVVLENLVAKGFNLIPADERHDFYTASFALKTIAKQHAVSHAVFQDCGSIDGYLKKFPNFGMEGINTSGFISIFNSSYQNAVDTSVAVLQKHEIPGRDDALATLKSYVGFSFEQMLDECFGVSDEPAPFVALVHGDYKNNNMMFNRDNITKEVHQHVAIDLQGVRHSSPVYDLSFYLFSSVDHTIRQTKLTDLLNVYVETVNEISSQLGVATNLQLEDVMRFYREKFHFGFFVALMLIGPGMQLFKSLDIEETDISQYFNAYNKLLLKWIDENSEAGKNLATEIIGLVQEFNKLKL